VHGAIRALKRPEAEGRAPGSALSTSVRERLAAGRIRLVANAKKADMFWRLVLMFFRKLFA